MQLKILLQMCVIALISVKIYSTEEIFEITTRLDDPRYRFLFHQFRGFIFNSIGKTSKKTKGIFLQEKFRSDMQFPCDTKIGKSPTKTENVHRLRPGDINVIGAMGDSLTCSTGAMAEKFRELSMENRGLAWSIGGQWNWRNATTLPNILKEFNPSLVGFSLDDSFPFHKASQLNVAEIGAVSSDLPYMAKVLVKRIQNDKRIDFKRDWKMITITIGGNDICSFICLMNDPEKLPEIHRISLTKTLRYLKNNLPRTFVNIVSVPNVETVMLLPKKPKICKFIHRGECACWVGTVSNVTKETRKRWKNIQQKFIAIEEAVAKQKEFRNHKEFAVVYQPFTTNISLSTNGKTDLSLLSFDCFHLSQKGNAYAGVSLWNNLLQTPNKKSRDWQSPLVKFLCPSEKVPYFYTYDNWQQFNKTVE